MSHPDLSLILSPQAEDDFADILQYTLETWGKNQLYIYRSVIDKALLTIQKNPFIGHQRQDISQNHQSFPAGSHVIFYRVTSDGLYVSRILHMHMDPRRQF